MKIEKEDRKRDQKEGCMEERRGEIRENWEKGQGNIMTEQLPLTGVSHGDWLRLRKTGIGGSDAGAICGLNPYSSPMTVFRDKTTEQLSEEDNEAMRQGRDLEDYVARRFTEATGLKVRRSNVMYRSKEHPFMLADVDRLIVGQDAGLECKTASAYNADQWKDGGIPPHYLIQCHHYMAVTGRKAWYLAVVILGLGFQYTRIDRDEEMIRNLISIEEEFWKNRVVPKIMPEPDGSKACDEVLEQYFRISRKGSAIPLIGFDEKLDRRMEIGRLISKLEREQTQIDQEIKLYLKENETACSERYRVSWVNVETARLDAKRIKAEQPELYRKFSHVASSRRFQVKAA